MRYVRMVLDTDFSGTKNKYCMKTNMNDRELDAALLDVAKENAESYEYLVLGWYYQTANENSYWEEISKEEYEEYLKDN